MENNGGIMTDGSCKYCGEPIQQFKKLILVESSLKYYNLKRQCVGCGKLITIRDLRKLSKLVLG